MHEETFLSSRLRRATEGKDTEVEERGREAEKKRTREVWEQRGVLRFLFQPLWESL